ncbi:MAG: substrate-CoA ligase [Candidatus Binatia bacterium]|nr:MAG: substrate-CoA ligase [Candidatus Binatia bacterium]
MFLLPTCLEFLDLQGRRFGEKPALVFGDGLVRYGELAEETRALAEFFASQGIGFGTPVGLFAANHPGLVLCHFALWALGAVVVPLSPRSKDAELSRLLEHVGASALVCDPARSEVASRAAERPGVATFVCEPLPPFRPAVARPDKMRHEKKPRKPGPATLAAVAYTSGTTGSPKGVALTHGNYLWSALACSGARGDTEKSVGTCLSPLTHVPVFVSHLLCRLLHGSTAVLFEKFSVDELFAAAEKHGVTDLSLIAGMVFDVTGLREIPQGVRRTVRKVSVGGAATPMDAKRKLAELFPGAEVIEAYGQSETTDGLTMARGRSVFERPGTVGRPNPWVVLRVRRQDRTFAGAGEDGEIVVRGPMVMRGYFRDPQSTREVLAGGWLRTGDVGRLDEDGYLYLTGRTKEIIITGGENVSPAEVESVIRAHPEVEDVAVIGTPHPKWGEQVTAVVVRRAGSRLTAQELEAFCGERLAGFKKPRRIEFVSALPRNAANKVEIGLLRRRFEKGEAWNIEDHSRESGSSI